MELVHKYSSTEKKQRAAKILVGYQNGRAFRLPPKCMIIIVDFVLEPPVPKLNNAALLELQSIC